MKQPSFSIIIPVYNAEKFLSAAIESVLKQSYGNWELLLINDGSKDQSREMCEKYVALHPSIRLLEHPQGVNKGVSASRNLGMREAKNDWLAFLDADDFWFLEKLETEARIISEHVQLALIYSKARMFDHAHSGFNGKDYGSGHSAYLKNPFLPCLKGMQIHLSNVSVKHQIIRDEAIHFNEKMRFSEDTLFCHEVLQYGDSYYITKALSHYRFSSQSATAIIPEKEQVLGRFVVYEHLLKQAKKEYQNAISFELVNTGLERVWKYALKFPLAYRKILSASLRKVLNNRNVKTQHKIRALFGPLVILFKFILKKVTA